MSSNPYTPNVFRKSYGFQSTNIPLFQNPLIQPKNIQKVQKTSRIVFPQSYNNTIKQIQNKLQNFEFMLKNKNNSQNVQNFIKCQQNLQKVNNRNQQKLFNPTLMRVSCQDSFQSFDYNKYKNQSNLNFDNKIQASNQIRKSPGRENPFKTNQNRKKSTFQSQQNIEEHIQQSKTSEFSQRISPSKNLIKFFNEKQNQKKITSKQIMKIPEKNQQDTQKIQKLKDQLKQIKTSLTISSKSSYETQREKPILKIGSIKNVDINHNKMINNKQQSPRKQSNILNGFQLGPILGKGKFGQVFLAKHHQLGFLVAIKKIQKQKIIQFNMVNQFVKQIRLHSSLDHPNIVKFYGIFQQKQSIYLVMQYLNGGTLFDYLNDVDALSVKQTAQFMKDVIDALNYMHSKSIAHRDIKPQNIVISSQKVAKLCDFGWSALVQTSRKTYCGTLDYAPPQILQRKDYDLSVDIWCIGVLTYQLLTGKVPFQAQQRKKVRDKIINVDKIKIDYPNDMPYEVRQFINAIIQKDPNKRPKCNQLLQFNFFNTYLHKGMKNKKIM